MKEYEGLIIISCMDISEKNRGIKWTLDKRGCHNSDHPALNTTMFLCESAIDDFCWKI